MTESERKELLDRIARLEAKIAPPQPMPSAQPRQYDPTEGMSMPASAMREMIAAEPRGFMANVVREQRTSPTSLPRSPTVSVIGAAPAKIGKGGWVEAKPVDDWRPPGQAAMDRMMDQEDAKWRADRAAEIAKRGGK